MDGAFARTTFGSRSDHTSWFRSGAFANPLTSHAFSGVGPSTNTLDDSVSRLSGTTSSSAVTDTALQDSTATPLSAADAPPIPKSPLVVQSDFNQDGQADLLWRDYATGQNTVWLMNGATRLSIVSLPTLDDPNWRIEGVADFTGDRQADILWRNEGSGQNVLWEMNGTAIASINTQLPSVSDLNWQIAGTADFTGDGKPDILWRNNASGQELIWAMDGTKYRSLTWLPNAPGSNLEIEATGDINQDGNADIVWRNTLSGENFVWLMNGTGVASTLFLETRKDAAWQIYSANDVNTDGRADLIWHNTATEQNEAWVIDATTFKISKTIDLPSTDAALQTAAQTPIAAGSSLVDVSNLAFDGYEGHTGTFQIRLTQAPTINVTLTFTTGAFTVVDADNNVADGTQTTITFTPQDWSQTRTVWFIAEDDASSSDRLSGNTVSYTLSGGLADSGTYELGKVTNTYAPDPTRFNIDLDFRNDTTGFWSDPWHQAIAQKAANDWANQIANEWTTLQLNSTINRLDSYATKAYSFITKRAVDDLLIFVNPYQSSASEEPAVGGPDYQFGGWISSPELMPRVGQIAVNTSMFTTQTDPSGWLLYQVVLHEIGHALGLVGLDWIGYNLEDRSTPQTASFQGEFSKAANGGSYVALQSQDGANPVTGTYDYSHPAQRVNSVMSYGGIYTLYGPTNLDFAMLADSGYRIKGINA